MLNSYSAVEMWLSYKDIPALKAQDTSKENLGMLLEFVI